MSVQHYREKISEPIDSLHPVLYKILRGLPAGGLADIFDSSPRRFVGTVSGFLTGDAYTFNKKECGMRQTLSLFPNSVLDCLVLLMSRVWIWKQASWSFNDFNFGITVSSLPTTADHRRVNDQYENVPIP